MTGLLAILLPALIALVLWRLSVQSKAPAVRSPSSSSPGEHQRAREPEESEVRFEPMAESEAEPEHVTPEQTYATAFEQEWQRGGGVIFSDGWARLDALALELRVTPEHKLQVERILRRAMTERHVGNIIGGGTFSPDLADALARWSRAMRGEANDIESGQLEELEHLARAWSLEHEPLPLAEVPIALQRGELCHAQTAVIWQEIRAHTIAGGSAGPVARIPLAAGLSFRLAAYKHTRIETHRLETIDHGPLYITNKRVIFNGARKNTAIRLSAIINVTPHENGIVIDKSSGRSPHLTTLAGDPLHLSTILRRVVAEANA